MAFSILINCGIDEGRSIFFFNQPEETFHGREEFQNSKNDPDHRRGDFRVRSYGHAQAKLLKAVYEALIGHQVIFSVISRSLPQAIRPLQNHSENPNRCIPFILIWKVMKTLFSSPTVPTILPTPTAGTQTSHSGRTHHFPAS